MTAVAATNLRRLVALAVADAPPLTTAQVTKLRRVFTPQRLPVARPVAVMALERAA